MKHIPLQVGERVWIESRYYGYSRGEVKRTIKEAEIIKANKSSAYAVDIDLLKKENPYSIRIDQKSRKIIDTDIMFTHSYHLWNSKEAFERDIEYNMSVDKASSELMQLAKSCKSIKKLNAAIESLK